MWCVTHFDYEWVIVPGEKKTCCPSICISRCTKILPKHTENQVRPTSATAEMRAKKQRENICYHLVKKLAPVTMDIRFSAMAMRYIYQTHMLLEKKWYGLTTYIFVSFYLGKAEKDGNVRTIFSSKKVLISKWSQVEGIFSVMDKHEASCG